MNSFSDFLKQLWQRLGSMSLAIVLLMVLSIASVIGTVLLQNQEQADYLQQFGPLWYWVLRSRGCVRYVSHMVVPHPARFPDAFTDRLSVAQCSQDAQGDAQP